MTAPEHPSDDELMVGIAGGDREAFAALYRRRRPDVFRFALHMTGSASAAEDVTQEAFLALIRDGPRYAGGRSGVVPWLLGIARNHARRRFERERPALPLSDSDGHDGKIDRALVSQADPLEELATEQRERALRKALAMLPPLYREAIILCDLQELTYADAAEALGCAVGTVRSRLHRGRGILAGRLRTAEDAPAIRMTVPRVVL
jgi:RNA polymerase sigma-70 factor (ECF subfamily)